MKKLILASVFMLALTGSMSASSLNEGLIVENELSVNEQGLVIEVQESISLLTLDICEVTYIRTVRDSNGTLLERYETTITASTCEEVYELATELGLRK